MIRSKIGRGRTGLAGGFDGRTCPGPLSEEWGCGTPGFHSPLFLPTKSNQSGNRLRAPQALAAIQALVTGAVAHGHVAAVGAGRRVQLKVGNGITKGCDRPSVD